MIARTTQVAGFGASMRVGALTWRVISAHASRQIKNQYLDATASGVYLIFELTATNATSRPAVPTSDQVTLRIGGVEYSPDPSSRTALELAGEKAVPTVALAARLTTTGWIAFDVGSGALGRPALVCFTDLSIHAKDCITTH
jgi:hypothetical protein